MLHLCVRWWSKLWDYIGGLQTYNGLSRLCNNVPAPVKDTSSRERTLSYPELHDFTLLMQKQKKKNRVRVTDRLGVEENKLSLKFVCLSRHTHAHTHRQTALIDCMSVITSNIPAVSEQGYWLYGQKMDCKNSRAVKYAQIKQDKLCLSTACSWVGAASLKEQENSYRKI